MTLTLEHADAIIAGTMKAARARNAQPMGVIVLDAGASIVAYRREDGATLFRFDIARAKATGALGMGSDTRALAEKAAVNPPFFASLAAVTGALALSPGGVLLRDAHGVVVGAVGVSGDTGDVDELCALAGIIAAGRPASVV